MVVSSVPWVPTPPLMRFPAVTSFRPIRPLTGAVTCVNSTSSVAAIDRGLRFMDRRLGLLHRRFADVRLLLRDCVAPNQIDSPRVVLLRQREAGLRQREFGLGASQRRFVGPGIDQEQQIALLDHRAVLEVDRLEVAAHARPHLDRVDRVEARGILVPFRDLARDRLDDGHLWRLGRRRRRSIAGAQRRDEDDCSPTTALQSGEDRDRGITSENRRHHSLESMGAHIKSGAVAHRPPSPNQVRSQSGGRTDRDHSSHSQVGQEIGWCAV